MIDNIEDNGHYVGVVMCVRLKGTGGEGEVKSYMDEYKKLQFQL